MKADVFSLVVFFFAIVGVVLLFCQLWPSGSAGNQNVAIPSRLASASGHGGGYLPGATTQGLRNGGVGAIQPIVWYN